MENNRMWQVCPQETCDNLPLMNVKVGNQTHSFCCLKGFEKSLKDFQEYQKKLESNQINKN